MTLLFPKYLCYSSVLDFRAEKELHRLSAHPYLRAGRNGEERADCINEREDVVPLI